VASRVGRPIVGERAADLARRPLIVCALAVAGCATDTGSRVVRIDASSPARFERSVALLQNQLPPRKREEFEVALGAIWLRNTAPVAADTDADGVVTFPEVQRSQKALELDAEQLLTEIRRGDLLTAIERREQADGEYAAKDYLEQLNGLTPDEAVGLADLGTVLEARRAAGKQVFQQVYCLRSDHPDWSTSRITNRCAR
jgi:hypothetical protein